MTCEQCYVCEQTVLQCSRTMLLAMTYDLCHGGHMVAEYPLLHTPRRQGLCSHLAHLWATSDFAPCSEAVGPPR